MTITEKFPFPSQMSIKESDEIESWRKNYADSTIKTAPEFKLPNRMKKEIIAYLNRNPRREWK